MLLLFIVKDLTSNSIKANDLTISANPSLMDFITVITIGITEPHRVS